MFVGRTAAFIIHCKGMFELLVHSRANINMDLLYICRLNNYTVNDCYSIIYCILV